MGREATSMQLQTASEAPAGDLSLPPRDGSLSTLQARQQERISFAYGEQADKK